MTIFQRISGLAKPNLVEQRRLDAETRKQQILDEAATAAEMLRVRSNPFHPWVEGRMLDFLGLADGAALTHAARQH